MDLQGSETEHQMKVKNNTFGTIWIYKGVKQ